MFGRSDPLASVSVIRGTLDDSPDRPIDHGENGVPRRRTVPDPQRTDACRVPVPAERPVERCDEAESNRGSPPTCLIGGPTDKCFSIIQKMYYFIPWYVAAR